MKKEKKNKKVKPFDYETYRVKGKKSKLKAKPKNLIGDLFS